MSRPETNSGAGTGPAPPKRSRWLLSDLRHFLLHKPSIPTLIDTHLETSRHDYEQRIRQRTGISVEQYSVLNLHRVAIDAPVRDVFEELLVWDGDSTCWPNHVAKVERTGGTLDEIQVNFLGIRFLRLFSMHSLKIQTEPGGDLDNARYLLYRCGGGYPMGMFSFYVRSAIAAEGEQGKTQFFAVVGFDFYGRRNWSQRNLIYRAWAAIHNRVTANVLNRFKQLCEWRFQQLQAGAHGRDADQGQQGS